MLIVSILKNKRLKKRAKEALKANPERIRCSKVQGGKHAGLSDSKRRKLSVKNSTKEEILNPWMAF